MPRRQPSAYALSEASRLRRLGGETLFPDFREAALSYYRDHHIAWWGGGPEPTASPISSQVACVNHLEPARERHEFALTLARNVQPDADAVLPIEDGFVAYEWIGERSYLGERGWSKRGRGKYATSLDALMAIQLVDGSVQLLVIEWKYTESYPTGESLATSCSGTSRVEIYRPLLEHPDCPIKLGDHQRLFYDPFQQLMRQTLLAWQMVEHGEFGASGWLHMTVAPEANVELRGQVTSPTLAGTDMADAWRSVLKEPRDYLIISPTELVEGEGIDTTSDWRRWLARRYET
jgi:hypothetical protein